MKKTSLLLVFLTFVIFTSKNYAQVTIGSKEPAHEKALLDIKENADGTSTKGVLLPRVALASAVDFFGSSNHEKGMIVYNTSFSATTVDTANRVSPGFYYNDGTRWERLFLGYANWFYMPSIPIKTSETLTGQTIDLYDRYKSQFSGTSGNFASSTGAPSTIPYFPATSDLYYYVTDYDPTVFSNISISASGVMTYDVTAAATDYTFINIVFVMK